MLRVFILSIALFISTLAHAASIVTGIVGNDEKRTTHVEPRAIVMQDENGNDAMVVFYRLREQKKDHLIGFSIARSVNEKGGLIWDNKDYILKSEVLSTRGFAPQPILLNNTLYVFGGENIKKGKQSERHIIYNSFDSLQDLIDHAQNGPSKSPAQDTKIVIGHLEYVSSTLYEGSQILFGYHSSYTGISATHAICQPSQKSLICQHSYKSHGNPDGTLNLANVDYNGQQETVMFTRSYPSRHFGFYFYDKANGNYQGRYILNGKNGNSDFGMLSPKSSASIQIDNILRVYYIEQATAIIHKTGLLLDDLYVNGGAFWADPTPFTHPVKQGGYVLRAKSGLSAVEFKDRVYVFYQQTDRVARYFVDEE